MAIVLEKKIATKDIALFLFLLFLGVLFVVNLFKSSRIEQYVLPPVFQPPLIDFEFLKKDIIKELSLFEPITPIPSEKAGRENPFLPY